MDTGIPTIASAAVRAMREQGYTESTISQYRKGFGYLEEFCEGRPYEPGIGRDFASAPKPDGSPYSRSYAVWRRKIARICDRYVADGAICLSLGREAEPPPVPESDGLLAALESYQRANLERGLAAATCDIYGRLAREFLLYLESEGACSPSDADASSVLGFMSRIKGRWARTTTGHLASNFRPFLKWLGREDLVDALRLARPRRKCGIVPSLSDCDEEAVARACCSGSVPAGDAAITLLALTTGMRACDIIGLKTGDVDWRAMTISVVQRKTGNPLTVPMGPGLAEALGRYLLEERPDASCPNVFVRQKAPHAPLSGHSAVYEATRRTLAAAGVEGGGTRMLRHNAASKMMRAGAKLPVISSVLGHAVPDSTGVYLEADEEGMEACVLPLPKGGSRARV